jgi:hypothetical protein
MQSIDLTKVFEQYKGMWVAFTDNYNVLAADKDAKNVYDAARRKGYKIPRLFKMPQRNTPFIGSHL